jgi:Ca2+-binding EF-hand superfamily protein
MRTSTLLLVAWPLLLLAQEKPGPKTQEKANPPAQEKSSPREQEEPDASDKTEQLGYFSICDHDGNGWISYREAKHSLRIDQTSYGVYDADSDGRVSFEEFDARYMEIVERAGGFRTPIPISDRRLVPTRNPEQLRNAYDRNGDRALNERELSQLLIEYGRAEIPAAIVLEKLDVDANGRLDQGEMEHFSRLLSGTYTLPKDRTQEKGPLPRTPAEIFGGPERRPEGFNVVPLPPRLPGPTTHFRRLDLDGDGKISREDLFHLQNPLQLPIRGQAMLSALDLNEDGGLDEQEFLLALQSPGAR